MFWFDPEVSTEHACLRWGIALDDLPKVPEVNLTDGALNSVLDLVKNGFSAWPLTAQAAASEEPSARPPAAAGPSEPLTCR